MALPVPTSEDELLEELTSLPESDRQRLARRAKNSLYFMSKGVLGHRDVNQSTHGAMCRFMQDDEKKRRMTLMPRFHLKSTVCTEADAIRIGVSDPEETRLLIVNEVDENARAMLSAVLGYFEKNNLLRWLFPECIPERFSGPGVKWNTAGANLVRRTSYKEPTYSAIGVGGAVTSRHYTHIKADDLIGLEAERSEAEMKKVNSWVDGIEALVVGAEQTIIDFIGTRWARHDTYGHIMEMYGPRLKVFRRQVVENGQIIFPQKITPEFLETLMKNPSKFAAQFMNAPLSGEYLDFNIEHVGFFRFDVNGAVLVNGRKWERDVLDIVISVDPNGGSKTAQDEAAISVMAMAPDEDVFILENYGGRPSPSELVDKIFAMCKRWRPRVVGIEEAGQQNTLHYFKKKCSQEKLFFRTEPMKHKNQDKHDRIRKRLEPLVTAKKLYTLVSQEELRHQLEFFPDVKLDDRIDTLAYGTELFIRPQFVEEAQKEYERVQQILATRNPVTGY